MWHLQIVYSSQTWAKTKSTTVQTTATLDSVILGDWEVLSKQRLLYKAVKFLWSRVQDRAPEPNQLRMLEGRCVSWHQAPYWPLSTCQVVGPSCLHRTPELRASEPTTLPLLAQRNDATRHMKHSNDPKGVFSIFQHIWLSFRSAHSARCRLDPFRWFSLL